MSWIVKSNIMLLRIAIWMCDYQQAALEAAGWQRSPLVADAKERHCQELWALRMRWE